MRERKLHGLHRFHKLQGRTDFIGSRCYPHGAKRSDEQRRFSYELVRITHHASRITLRLILMSCFVVSAAELDPSKLPPAAQVTVNFEKDVKPIFESTCLR